VLIFCFYPSYSGKDINDTVHGGDDDDVILGDNGEILREVESIETEFPWIVHVWKRYTQPFDTEKIRDVRRYDDIDYVQGDDTLNGGMGNDIIHGQRGNDWIYGNEGDGE
jgi:Ca2+-binding RTX toxin-like protein